MKSRAYLLIPDRQFAESLSRFCTISNFNLLIRILIPGILLVALSGCRQNDEYAAPELSLRPELSTLHDSSVVAIGAPFKVTIECVKGDAPITNLVINLTTESGTENVIDSGMYCNHLIYSRNTAYGASDFEKWTFYIRDKNGKSSSKSMVIFKDKNSVYGPIKTYSSIKLGLQDNSVYGQFLSLSEGHIFRLPDALANQSLVNAMAYWADKALPPTDATFSSPNESDAPTYYPIVTSFGAPLNEMRYKADSLGISIAAFEKAFNDSLIIANYTSATAGKRKFKNARPGYVIPFQVTTGQLAGCKGLIKVNDVQRGTTGYIDISVKIQQKTK